MVSVGQIAKWSSAKILQEAPHKLITELCIDSRKIIFPEESIFIALKTGRRDGQQFMREAYAKGIRSFLIHSPVALSEYPDANILEVADTLLALQHIAIHYRQQFQIPVIGITGSNGKTIVKEWLYQLLSPDLNVVRSPKSYNSQIGVALSVWKLDNDTQLGIFEAGISQPDEMQHLQKMMAPTIGLCTNIGEAHNEGFVNDRQKISEKIKLFTDVSTLYFCKDYPALHESIVHSQAHLKHVRKLVSWSAKQEADLSIKAIRIGKKTTTIEGYYKAEATSIEIPFTDPASIENATHCWLYLLDQDYEEPIIQARMMQLHPVAMRLELKQGINNCSLINDTYNSDLTSLRIALEFLQQQKQHPKHTLVLSDLLQSGKPEAVLYQEVAELIGQSGVHRLIAVGPSMYRYKDFFKTNKHLRSNFFKSTDDLIRLLPNYEPHNEAILLKGARSFHFERVSKLLEEKIHQTVLSIDLSAMLHNLNVYKQQLPPQVKMMVMVKAFSYGSGSYEIAQTLQFAGVDYLSVAYTDEGVALRRSGITVPIMVMSPESASFERMIAWNLEPELYNDIILDQFIIAAHRQKTKAYPVHIKLDTGMHRLGFEQQDLGILIERLNDTDAIKAQSLFSHLSASEDPSMNAFTSEQHRRFNDMTETVIRGIGYTPLRHVSNSAAIASHPELHYDMVRLGIGLHGIDTTGVLQAKLQNVSTLKTTIAQIKTVPIGETIGYGRKGTINRATQVATISIGYADGYPRSLSGGVGHVVIKNQMAPIIGVVCMDMCMVDVTDIADVQVGDEVIIFGAALSIAQLAQWADTIPYEIMTGISQRVKRIYENDA